jgi:hypothetical protein
MSLLCQPVSLIGARECSFGMPPSGFVIPFFIVFGSRTMSLSGKFVLLRGFPVCVMHGVCSEENTCKSETT